MATAGYPLTSHGPDVGVWCLRLGANVNSRVTTAALAIVPGPDATVTFVRQQRGPYAGALLLPGGKIEFGESAADAARREAAEEAGCEVGVLSPTGVYEIRSGRAEDTYHFVMFAFLATGETPLRDGFGGHHVDGVLQAQVDQVRPHPTVMRILNDAGVGSYREDEIEADLTESKIAMTCFPVARPVSVG